MRMNAMGRSEMGEIGQIGLTSRDIARSVEYYGDKLGVRLVYQGENAAFFDCDGVRLMLGPAEGTGTVYFRVDQIHQAARELAARGVVFDREPHLVAKMTDHELWMAFFRDPDGNRLALMGKIAT
jgi:methylmalonyl-CoA/ethylmalonyl-CoA epimerase